MRNKNKSTSLEKFADNVEAIFNVLRNKVVMTVGGIGIAAVVGTASLSAGDNTIEINKAGDPLNLNNITAEQSLCLDIQSSNNYIKSDKDINGHTLSAKKNCI